MASQIESRAVNTYIACEYKEIISKDIENSAGQHADGGKCRMIVVAQECRKHLVP